MKLNIPHSQDIRTLGPAGQKSQVAIQLADVLPLLSLATSLRESLQQLSRAFADLSLYILTDPRSAHSGLCEGRGRYSLLRFGQNDLVFYSKGVGCAESLLENETRPFGAFGPLQGRYLFDPPTRVKVYPRTVGGLYLEYGCREFINALRVFVDLTRRYGIASFRELVAEKLICPVSLARFDGLSELLQQPVRSEVSARWQNEPVRFAAATSLVPSMKRVSGVLNSGCRDDLRLAACLCTARGVRELFLASSAIHSASSVHRGNMYFSDARCPIADYSDLVFLDALSPEERIRALAQFICRIFPSSKRFFSGLEPQQVYRAMIRELLGELPQLRKWSLEYMESPRKTALDLAAQLEQSRTQEPFRPPDELLNRILEPQEYWRILDHKRKQVLRISDRFFLAGNQG